MLYCRKTSRSSKDANPEVSFGRLQLISPLPEKRCFEAFSFKKLTASFDAKAKNKM